MAFHTLKQSLHTLSKISEYQINNVLVYAVYAKTYNYFFMNRFSIIFLMIVSGLSV